MAWIIPTTATVKARISGPEFESLKGAARAAGQNADTLVTDCIARVVAMIRGYVGGRSTLGEAGGIPDELESAFGALWTHEFITRLPGMTKLLDDRRMKAYDTALAMLRDVSAGRFTIVAPATPAPEASQAGGSGFAWASGSTRQNTTANLNGLL